MAAQQLSPLGAIVRRHDPDRFFTALFAPAERRETLFLLYALNHELARANEVAREPFAALIRLQWWREVVEGARRRHEVAGPLGEALDAGRLDGAELLRMIGAREAEAEGIETAAGFESALLDGAGGLMVAAGRALGLADADRLREPGAGCGAIAVLRNLVGGRRTGSLPPVEPGDEAAPEWLARVARGWLESRAAVPRAARAAVLPAVLARRKLARWARGKGSLETSLADRVAVMGAAWRP